MVEVDVFWSYGIGASFALGAFRQLRKTQAERDPGEKRCGAKEVLRLRRVIQEIEKGDSPAFDNQYFMKTLLFLSLLFVPSGANLLWSNPNWETMQVGSYETIPGWLVSAFTITNVTQGILGYWATYNSMMKGKYYRAAMQTMARTSGSGSSWSTAGTRPVTRGSSQATARRSTTGSGPTSSAGYQRRGQDTSRVRGGLHSADAVLDKHVAPRGLRYGRAGRLPDARGCRRAAG